jgi:RimJ/RimL family protein N-acetyltransferase
MPGVHLKRRGSFFPAPARPPTILGIMSCIRTEKVLRYCRLDREHIDAVLDLDYGSPAVAAFLDPIVDILGAVRSGLAHTMIGIADSGGLVGFFVVHPDARDQSCWWLGWFAIDRPHRGLGYGRDALAHIIATLCHIDRCRHIRLLVARDNAAARRLYDFAGFRKAGHDGEGWDILEYDVPAHDPRGVGRSPEQVRIDGIRAKRVRRRQRLQPIVGPCSARCMVPVRAPPAQAAAA